MASRTIPMVVSSSNLSRIPRPAHAGHPFFVIPRLVRGICPCHFERSREISFVIPRLRPWDLSSGFRTVAVKSPISGGCFASPPSVLADGRAFDSHRPSTCGHTLLVMPDPIGHRSFLSFRKHRCLAPSSLRYATTSYSNAYKMVTGRSPEKTGHLPGLVL